MWELDYKESWAPKKWCFWTVVLQKIFASSLVCKAIQPVHPNGDQSWVFTGRTDVEAKTPILGPPDVKCSLIGKRPWCWERLRAGGEGGDRAWDGWMASPTQWIWFWANSGRWWRTGKPCELQSTGLQSAGHNLVTEQQGGKNTLTGMQLLIPLQLWLRAAQEPFAVSSPGVETQG